MCPCAALDHITDAWLRYAEFLRPYRLSVQSRLPFDPFYISAFELRVVMGFTFWVAVVSVSVARVVCPGAPGEVIDVIVRFDVVKMTYERLVWGRGRSKMPHHESVDVAVLRCSGLGASHPDSQISKSIVFEHKGVPLTINQLENAPMVSDEKVVRIEHSGEVLTIFYPAKDRIFLIGGEVVAWPFFFHDCSLPFGKVWQPQRFSTVWRMH